MKFNVVRLENMWVVRIVGGLVLIFSALLTAAFPANGIWGAENIPYDLSNNAALAMARDFEIINVFYIILMTGGGILVLYGGFQRSQQKYFTGTIISLVTVLMTMIFLPHIILLHAPVQNIIEGSTQSPTFLFGETTRGIQVGQGYFGISIWMGLIGIGFTFIAWVWGSPLQTKNEAEYSRLASQIQHDVAILQTTQFMRPVDLACETMAGIANQIWCQQLAV